MQDNTMREREAEQLNAEAFDVLIAISVIARRLAKNLSNAKREKGSDSDERSAST